MDRVYTNPDVLLQSLYMFYVIVNTMDYDTPYNHCQWSSQRVR